MKHKIRINGKIIHLGGFLIMMLFMAVKCNKHKDTLIGPEYKLAGSDFQVLPSTPPALKPFYMLPRAVDFSSLTKDTVRFYATFSQRVTWSLDLKGLSSGAKKRFTSLSQNLQGFYWTGKADDLIMFSSGEDVEATLSFMGTTFSVQDTIHINTKRTNNSNVIKSINDFETTPNGAFPNTGTPPYWYSYSATPADVIWNGANNDKSILTFDPRVPSGNKYYLLEGTDKMKGYFIEGAGFDKQLQIPTYTNPDSVYFNIYVYGFGLSNTKFQVGFDEDDKVLDGIYDPLTEDEYDYAVKVDWTGWRLLSFKYSATVVGVSPNGGDGNHVREPNRIQKMGFNINSDPSGGTSKVAFDYPVFTYGAPFDPNN